MNETLLEELSEAYRLAGYDARGDSLRPHREGLRAMLALLARKGVEGLPSVTEIFDAWHGGPGDLVGAAEKRVEELLVSGVAPLLAARDAGLAEMSEIVEVMRSRFGELEIELAKQNGENATLRGRIAILRSHAEATEAPDEMPEGAAHAWAVQALACLDGQGIDVSLLQRSADKVAAALMEAWARRGKIYADGPQDIRRPHLPERGET